MDQKRACLFKNMIYFPVSWICRINPVPLLPPQISLHFGVPCLQPTRASPLLGWEGHPPPSILTMNRGETLAHKPWPSSQEADKTAGCGLGKQRQRDGMREQGAGTAK